MKILFFDDEKIRFDIFKARFATDEIVYCQTFSECAEELQKHIEGKIFFDIIHFDHDIQDLKTFNWQTSTPLAEWFAQHCPKDKAPKMCVIHSVNNLGSWELYHIFSKITKSFMCPFRVETSEYEAALAAIGKEKNDKIQERQKEVPQ